MTDERNPERYEDNILEAVKKALRRRPQPRPISRSEIDAVRDVFFDVRSHQEAAGQEFNRSTRGACSYPHFCADVNNDAAVKASMGAAINALVRAGDLLDALYAKAGADDE